MKNLLGKLLLILTLTALSGCGKPATKAPSAEAEPVFAVIRAQTDALNRKDVDGMMSTIDPASPAFAATKSMSEQLFKMYDLRYTVENMKLESMSGDTARVRVTQLTEKASGPAFRNNRMEAIHTLKKHDGQWKLASTEIVKTDFLDK